jgi:hypothetical protein
LGASYVSRIFGDFSGNNFEAFWGNPTRSPLLTFLRPSWARGPKRVGSLLCPAWGGAADALAWLAGRAEFWTSIWRDQPLPRHFDKNRPPLDRPVFVPAARDGGLFHPGLRRNGAYTVGPKGDETHIADYEAALGALQRMPAAYWRRPNDAGAWGVVRAVEWLRLDISDLEAIAATQGPSGTPE